MGIKEKEIQLIVEEVLRRMDAKNLMLDNLYSSEDINKKDETSLIPFDNNIIKEENAGPLYETLEECISKAEKAQKKLIDLGITVRKNIISSIRKIAIENAEYLAKITVEETRMGRVEDKIKKNLLSAEKTPGVEDIQPIAFTGDRGLTLTEFAPVGIIASVTPSTNPTSTIINNTISILSAGNAVIFAPHPASKKCSQETIKLLNKAIIFAGGPAGLISSVINPSIHFTQNLLKHEKIEMIIVTGGPAIVKIAFSTGKKIIAAGPGNPPCIVDESALIEKAVTDVIDGASFDNGILCTAEKETLVLASVFEKFINVLRNDSRAFELSSFEMDKLSEIVIKTPGGKCKESIINKDFVGRNPCFIANAIGLNISENIRLLWGIVEKNHPFIRTEQLMPVMPVVKMNDIDDAIKFAIEVEGNNHHTFIMHSLNVENLTKMARSCQGSIFVKNGPSYMGLGMGEGYASLSIATPTFDGLVKAANFTRPIRCMLVDYFRII